MAPRGFLSVVRERRAALRRRFDLARQFAAIEESCVPSYVHGNWAAAMVAWLRLAGAARLYRRLAPPGPVLDFGAATGELYHVLRRDGDVAYCFVEMDAALAEALLRDAPRAQRRQDIEPGAYAAIFALDSLEHNDNFAELLAVLAAGLRPDGVLILSGPTESWLYRLGRRVAGFSGHYHRTNIFHIEAAARKLLHLRQARQLPSALLPLFRVSAWSR